METNNFEPFRKLLPDSSRRCIGNAARIISTDEALFLKMLELALLEEPVISARASRAVKYAAVSNPDLYLDNLSKIILKLPELSNESVKSAFLSIIMLNELPDDEGLVGLLMNFCFEEIDKVSIQAGPKVFSMDILYNISNRFPELKIELKAIIESRAELSSPAVRARSNMILKKLSREIRPYNTDFP